MKTILTTILILIMTTFFISSSCYSQDLIIFRNGNMVKSKVLQVSDSKIQYKKWDNLKGPVYTTTKSDVFMIKYQNGTKDVFKFQAPVNSNNTAQTNEELKKKEAVARLVSYLEPNIHNPIKLIHFQKTNGEMRNYYGQTVYTINFNVTIKFISDGWKKGNGLVGYWQNFYVYSSRPNLYASGQQYMYGIKYYPKGTELILGCVADMDETDNGFEVKSLKIKTIQNLVVVYQNKAAGSSQNNNGTVKQNKHSEVEKIANPYYSEKDLSLVKRIIDLRRTESTNKSYYSGEFIMGTFLKTKIEFDKSPKYDNIFILHIIKGRKKEGKSVFMYYGGILFYHQGNVLVIVRKIPRDGIGYRSFNVSPLSAGNEYYYYRKR